MIAHDASPEFAFCPFRIMKRDYHFQLHMIFLIGSVDEPVHHGSETNKFRKKKLQQVHFV